jgi:hypothetical protein
LVRRADEDEVLQSNVFVLFFLLFHQNSPPAFNGAKNAAFAKFCLTGCCSFSILKHILNVLKRILISLEGENMTKQGRPGVTYARFVELWEQLLSEGRATTRLTAELLSSSTATITDYRRRYETAKESQARSIIKEIELPTAIVQAIAAINVKEIVLLEESKQAVENRESESLKLLTETETKLADLLAQMEELKTTFEAEKLTLERKLAASQARIDDLLQREQKSDERYQQLTHLYHQAFDTNQT